MNELKIKVRMRNEQPQMDSPKVIAAMIFHLSSSSSAFPVAIVGRGRGATGGGREMSWGEGKCEEGRSPTCGKRVEGGEGERR